MNIMVIVGSLRKDSFNRKVAETMLERYRNKMKMIMADIGALPFFNQDQELDPPQVVKDFKSEVAKADGLIIVTPEYNWSIPGVLKNALDWTSRGEKVMIGKPVMPLGATPGMMGTIRAQLHLREILSAPGIQAKVLPPGGNEVLINLAAQKIDKQLVDESTLKFLDEKIEVFIDFVKSNQS